MSIKDEITNDLKNSKSDYAYAGVGGAIASINKYINVNMFITGNYSINGFALSFII